MLSLSLGSGGAAGRDSSKAPSSPIGNEHPRIPALQSLLQPFLFLCIVKESRALGDLWGAPSVWCPSIGVLWDPRGGDAARGGGGTVLLPQTGGSVTAVAAN